LAFNNDSLKSVPEIWREQLSGQLDEGESLLGWFETDLDLRLHYAPGLVALTDRRLLASLPTGENTELTSAGATNSQANGKAARWRSWLLSADLKLSAADQAGVGTLELLNETSSWLTGDIPRQAVPRPGDLKRTGWRSKHGWQTRRSSLQRARRFVRVAAL